MGDQQFTEEGGYAVMRGSIPPTEPNELIEFAFQYRIRIESTEIPLELTLPLRASTITVVSQAPAGLRLEVEGMGPTEEREQNGTRYVLTGRRYTPEDAPPITVRVRLTGIPAVAGLERTVAALLALFVVLGALVLGALNARKRSGRAGTRERLVALAAHTQRLLSEGAGLARARAEGDLGPETYARRRRELAQRLARVLKETAEVEAAAKAPRSSQQAAAAR
jgi:hypothetical protein